MSGKYERALVQGTVKFEINCNVMMGLVTPEIANDEYKLKDWLLDQAFKRIDLASVDVEIDNVEQVNISKDTALQHSNKIVRDVEWKKIKSEDKQR